MVKAKKYILAKHFDGLPKPSDLELIEEELPSLKDGEFLAEAVFLSIAPFLRAYEPSMKVGSVIFGSQVARIIESKTPKFPVGKHIIAHFGWCTHTISDGKVDDKVVFNQPIRLVPDFGSLPLSLALGVLGMPGNTAYFGFLEICQPKFGETVVVTAAAGAVGSHVGQIAKIRGCKVIGVTGNDKKGNWIVNELDFDHFINCKKSNFTEKLLEYAPNGVDCYFDNVGGEISSIIIHQMNSFGRISVCGAIAGYDSYNTNLPKATLIQKIMVMQQLKMQGFVVYNWASRWQEGINQNLQWVKEGKLKYRETITNGFENVLNAFVDMLQGGNYGKTTVKV